MRSSVADYRFADYRFAVLLPNSLRIQTETRLEQPLCLRGEEAGFPTGPSAQAGVAVLGVSPELLLA